MLNYEERELAQLKVTSGGWYGGAWLTKRLIRQIEKRWIERAYSFRADKSASSEAKERFSAYELDTFQCGGCKFFACWQDFGLCWNPDSPMDGRITFEHAGCLKHSSLKNLLATEEICG